MARFDDEGAEDAAFDLASERLADAIMRRDRAGARRLLQDVAATLGLDHIACDRFETNEREDVVARSSLATYPEAWRRRYASRRYADIDPVAMVGMYARHPFDWRSFRVLSRGVDAFLDDAAAHGLGPNGLTVPLRGDAAGFALVSFTSAMRPEDWDAYKRRHLPRLKALACLVCVVAGGSVVVAARRPPLRWRMLSLLQFRAA